MHGDIFSNSRLERFGLRQDSKCANCPEQVETIIHKVSTCPKAIEAWRALEKAKTQLELNNLTDLTIENLVGAKDRVSKLELALQAELIHRLTSTNGAYCPRQLAKIVVRFVGYNERLSNEIKDKFKEVVRCW